MIQFREDNISVNFAEQTQVADFSAPYPLSDKTIRGFEWNDREVAENWAVPKLKNDWQTSISIKDNYAGTARTAYVMVGGAPVWNVEALLTIPSDGNYELFNTACLPYISAIQIDGDYITVPNSPTDDFTTLEDIEYPTTNTYTLTAGKHKLRMYISNNLGTEYLFEGITTLTELKIGGDALTKVGNGCCMDCTGLTVVICNEGITALGTYCFADSTYMRTVYLPSSLNLVQDYAFSGTAVDYYFWFNANTSEINFTEHAMDGLIFNQTNWYRVVGTFDTIVENAMHSASAYVVFEDTNQIDNIPNEYGDSSGDLELSTVYTEFYQYAILPISQNYLTLAGDYPIWQDTFMEISADTEYIDYRIEAGGSSIYSGRAYIIDGATCVRLNRIVESYIESDFNPNEITESSGLTTSTYKPYIIVSVHYSTDDWATETDYGNYRFYLDWSYEAENRSLLDFPAATVLDDRQYFISAAMSHSDEISHTVNVYDTDGSIMSGSTSSLEYTSSMKYLPLSGVGSITVTVSGNTNTYTVKRTCATHCMYYRNKYGGYDSLLFNRTSRETDNFTISSYRTDSNNNSIGFETVQYNKDNERKFKLKSYWIAGGMSGRVADAFASTEAYLQDLETGEIIAVNITNTNVARQTFHNNGRKMIQYTVEVSDARKRRFK